MGAVGLMTFAVIVWKFMTRFSPWMVLAIGTAAWAATVISVWLLRRRALHVIRDWWSPYEIKHS